MTVSDMMFDWFRDYFKKIAISREALDMQQCLIGSDSALKKRAVSREAIDMYKLERTDVSDTVL